MPETMQWRNDLDFLRLASDLTQLTGRDLDLELKADLFRIARLCTDLVELRDAAPPRTSPLKHLPRHRFGPQRRQR
jgi:hypothetical protein